MKKKRKTRQIEVYVGESSDSGDSGAWSTMYVDIPANTLKSKIHKKAISVAYSQLRREEREDIAFVGVYNIPPKDDLEDLEDLEE